MYCYIYTHYIFDIIYTLYIHTINTHIYIYIYIHIQCIYISGGCKETSEATSCSSFRIRDSTGLSGGDLSKQIDDARRSVGDVANRPRNGKKGPGCHRHCHHNNGDFIVIQWDLS